LEYLGLDGLDDHEVSNCALNENVEPLNDCQEASNLENKSEIEFVEEFLDDCQEASNLGNESEIEFAEEFLDDNEDITKSEHSKIFLENEYVNECRNKLFNLEKLNVKLTSRNINLLKKAKEMGKRLEIFEKKTKS
jgi:hypothetical protein